MQRGFALSGRVTRDDSKLSVRRRSKEAGMGERGVGDRRGIRQSFSHATLKLDGTLT